MYLTDYHTHTRLSPDSEADPALMAAAARQAGLSELCVTDHVDFLNLRGELVRLSECGEPWYPPETARELSADGFILRRGIELGSPWEDPELADYVYSWPVDFVIGSVHNLDLAHGGTDLFFMDYGTPEACYQALDIYFDCMERLAAMDCFDILGHIPYPLRYMNDRDHLGVTLDRYDLRLERICKTLIAGGKGIEVNTNRGRQMEVWPSLLAIYRDCGGELVTLGSDAHEPAHVSLGIPRAGELLKQYGFDLAVYEKHQPKLVKL